ncbi:MAG: ribonuclease HII [Anaerolineae bacterium]|nr:ribonuclease HII [Anaerolineae bacterium]
MRQSPDLSVEEPLWSQGLVLAGLDEAGRGAWAGPVSAGAVILPPSSDILTLLNGVRDSKQMTPLQRERWAETIKIKALSWGVGLASNEEIDTIGILAATRLAMRRALAALYPQPQHLLIDALRLPEISLPQTPLIKGDSRCLSIAAASVLAKTTRDKFMSQAAQFYPVYGFENHKGYGTARHLQAMQQDGLSPIHRTSYAPCRALQPGQESIV